MDSQSKSRVDQLQALPGDTLLNGRLVGLEKESLRVEASGVISQTDHPAEFGAALTNPYITTDYSEALLEIVTPALESPSDAIQFLENAHRFIYPRLPDNQTIWATSMPCVIHGDDSIRVGEYGNSNAGRMKHVYRQGLGLRYGKSMQAIAGVHFNYSYPSTFWEQWHSASETGLSLQAFTTDEYFHMTRNLLRVGWLVPYLFGASPAICRSFLKGGDLLPGMQSYGEHSCFEPFGTSLRLGDIGYVYSKDDSGPKIRVRYNSLEGYVSDLLTLIETPDERYGKLGLRDEQGVYQQLSTSRLQIENEYYSSIRPKQIPQDGEMPLLAMARSGIRYLELRSLDINVFEPLGISEEQIHFLEILMLHSLLTESPPMSSEDLDRVSTNMSSVAHKGRDPALQLLDGDLQPMTVKAWGGRLLQQMQGTAEYLDSISAQTCYTVTLDQQRQKVNDPELTPSARVVREMHEKHTSFFDFALFWSKTHAEKLRAGPTDNDQIFIDAAAQSIETRHQIEASSEGTFEDYLSAHFAQLKSPIVERIRAASQHAEQVM